MMGMKREFDISKVGEIACVVYDHITTHPNLSVVTLAGDLGAGKTTLVQALAGLCGVEEKVASPTYVIEKAYELHGQPFKRLIHIDAYRLGSCEELLALGWRERVDDSHALILLEWPERVEGCIPSGALRIKLEHVSENVRRITMNKQ